MARRSEDAIVDMSEAIGPGWTLRQTPEGRTAGTWQVRYDDRLIGSVERVEQLSGRVTGWRALLNGIGVSAFGTLTARKGSPLWRTRDMAAAGIAFQAVHNNLAPKHSMPTTDSRAGDRRGRCEFSAVTPRKDGTGKGERCPDPVEWIIEYGRAPWLNEVCGTHYATHYLDHEGSPIQMPGEVDRYPVAAGTPQL
jgi:hypothetical protein